MAVAKVEFANVVSWHASICIWRRSNSSMHVTTDLAGDGAVAARGPAGAGQRDPEGEGGGRRPGDAARGAGEADGDVAGRGAERRQRRGEEEGRNGGQQGAAAPALPHHLSVLPLLVMYHPAAS